MKIKWTVFIKEGDKYVKLLQYNDYDSVQNLIGYLMEGTEFMSFDIKKEVADE